MPYQGLIFAAVLGIGMAVAVGMFIASTQWEQYQSYGEDSRRRRGGYNQTRRESRNYEQTTCPICRDSLVGNPSQLRTLRCKHNYHNMCIQRWFREQSINAQTLCCPVCREPAGM